MPDPIRCSEGATQPHIISCDAVVIGPETSPAPASAAPATAAPGSAAPASATPTTSPPPSPAVATLVNRFSPLRVPVHAEPVARLTLATAERCAGQVLDWAPLLLKLKADPLALGLGLVKADYDLQQCLFDDIDARQRVANRNAGVLECEAHGGTALGEVGNELTCSTASQPAVKP